MNINMKLIVLCRRSIIIFILLFIVVSIVTLEIKSPYDGNDLVGFPFRFYEFLGGKRTPVPLTRSIFNYLNLVNDIVVIGITSIVIDNLIRRLKKKNTM